MRRGPRTLATVGARAEATPDAGENRRDRDRTAEPCRGVLAPAAERLASADIHADADSPAGPGESKRGAGLLEPNGEHLVVDQLVAHRLVATDPR